jgi:hypothetical protein
MAKRTAEPKSKSSTAKKDAELRKLLDKPDFPSFDRMMKRLIVIPKEEIDRLTKPK